jgi:MFS family permease
VVIYTAAANFTYAQFTLTSLTFIITQFLTMRYWGKLSDRFGSKKILAITGWLVSFVPISWVLSSNFYWILLFTQVFAGFAWGGFSLASGNFIFDAVSPPKRARCVAYYSLFSNVGLFIGANFGGWLSTYLPKELILFGWHIALVSSLLWLFLISSLLRLFITAVFIPHIREVREVEAIPTWELIFQISHIKPLIGPIFEIFTGGKEEK